MGHGIRLYCAHGFSELSKIRGVWGLDKILVVAPEVVQFHPKPGTVQS
jgi:hypothetical protein